MQDCSTGSLQSRFSKLSLQPRECGLVNLVNMPWNGLEANTTQQFKSIYISRLDKMEAKFSKGGVIPIASISSEGSYTIRGLIKRLEHNRIRAFEKGFDQKYSGAAHIFDDKDEMEIEDKSGKIKFYLTKKTTHNIPDRGPLKESDLPSGACLVLTGQFIKYANKFDVGEVLIPGIAKQLPFHGQFPREGGISIERTILVLSEPRKEQLIKVKAVLNSICPTSTNLSALVLIGGMGMNTEDILMINSFVEEVKDQIDVFVMPSSGPERQHLLPLRPYHPLFFPKSHSEIGLCSNPQFFKGQNQLLIRVSCGEEVSDFLKNSSLARNQIEAMKLMLYLGHYCPSSPFSLKTEPFKEDYFVVENLPHILISGKAESYQSEVVSFEQNKQVLLICVPRGEMVIVGLNELGSRMVK